jgi:hypothetical protein
MEEEVMSTDTDNEREQKIRVRAYQIWIEEGQPTDREHEHWKIAEREVTGASPPLQPATSADETTGAGRRAKSSDNSGSGKGEASVAVGGINPDDVTR